MNRLISHCILVAVLFTVATISCTDNRSITAIEVTNGDCTGKIYNTDNSVAVGAAVHLIPSGYDPASPSSERILSTVTGADGRYRFKVTETDFYNIIAEKDGASCMQDSVSILADIESRIDNDTLEESGWLSGRIMVKTDGNPSQAIVLVLGTNKYISPDDSLGNFTALSLPAGQFNVRIFTTESGYDVLDTIITIHSGDTTKLLIRIPISDVPEVNELGVHYDSATMFATLQWTPVDTSLFLSYAIHRFINGNQDTIITINKSLSGYTDDCFFFLEDTIVYAITTVGNNFKEGYKTIAPAIIACNKAQAINKTQLDNYTYGGAFWETYVNYDGDIYVSDQKSILKVDSDGSVVNAINMVAIENSDGYNNISSIRIDTSNHLYVLVIGRISDIDNIYSIYKLDSEFNVVASMSFPDSFTFIVEGQSKKGYGPDIFVDEDGTVYLHSYYNIDLVMTKIQVYDTAFSFVEEYNVNDNIMIQQCHGDTIMAISSIFTNQIPFNTGGSPIIKIYNRSFIPLSSYGTIDVFADTNSIYVRQEGIQRVGSHTRILSSDIYLIDAGINYILFDSPEGNLVLKNILVLANSAGDLLGRFILDRGIRYSILSLDHMYGISFDPGLNLYTFNLKSYLKN